MGKIRIENMSFKAYHGVYPKENKIGGEFVVDVELNVDIVKAGKSDKLEDTYDYSIVYEICKREMTIVSKLIEYVGTRIKTSIAKELKIKKKNISVKITKKNPPIKGFNGEVSVEL
jgi:dihydroneopterin aldolase